MRIFGIDPGLAGAIAILDEKKIVEVIDLPTMSDGKKSKKQLNSAHLAQYISNNIVDINKRLSPPIVNLQNLSLAFTAK